MNLELSEHALLALDVNAEQADHLLGDLVLDGLAGELHANEPDINAEQLGQVLGDSWRDGHISWRGANRNHELAIGNIAADVAVLLLHLWNLTPVERESSIQVLCNLKNAVCGGARGEASGRCHCWVIYKYIKVQIQKT